MKSDDLFRVLFFLIAGVIWISAGMRKRKRWDDELPDFPDETDSSSEPSSSPESTPEEVSYEGRALPESVPVEQKPVSPAPATAKKRRFSSLKEYEEYLAQREVQTRETTRSEGPDTPVAVSETTSARAPVSAYHAGTMVSAPSLRALQDDVRQGIIWSIIIGPCRAKTGPLKHNIRV